MEQHKVDTYTIDEAINCLKQYEASKLVVIGDDGTPDTVVAAQIKEKLRFTIETYKRAKVTGIGVVHKVRFHEMLDHILMIR